MNRRILRNILCAIFSTIIAILIAITICITLINGGVLVETEGNINNPAAITPGSNEIIELSSGFYVSPSSDKSYKVYGDVKVNIEESKYVGYSINNQEFKYNEFVGEGLTESIYHNGINIVDKFYEKGDMNLDIILPGNSMVTMVYNDDNKLSNIFVNEGIYSVEYKKDKVNKVYINDSLDKEISYNKDGQIKYEVNPKGEKIEYSYSEGKVESSLYNINANVNYNSITYIDGSNRYDYIFDYTYEGQMYITEIRLNNKHYRKYAYLNDSIVGETLPDGNHIEYILDSNFKQVGMIYQENYYYFIYDVFGNICSLLDENSNVVNFIDYQMFGVTNISGIYFGFSFLNNESLFDLKSNVIINKNEVVFSKAKVKVSITNGKELLSDKDSLYQDHESAFTSADGITIETAIREKVMEQIIAYFDKRGYAVATNVSVVNIDGDNVDFIDLYVLDSVCAGDKIKNALNGNMAYSLISSAEDYSNASSTIKNYVDDNSDYYIEYYEIYGPKCGNLSFNGQFIYLDYLINYYSEGDGIIVYDTVENKVENLNRFINVYNYDKKQYEVFSSGNFVFDSTDFTKIIPGLNQENYLVVEEYIQEALKISTEASRENVEYFDDTYYKNYVNSVMGDTLDNFVNIDDKAMITLSSTGDLEIKAIPFKDSTYFRKNVCRMVGTVVVSAAIVGGIAIINPALGGVAFMIFKTALVTSVKSIVSSCIIAIGIDAAKQHVFGQELNMSFNDALYRYFDSLVNGFYSGYISGVIASTGRFIKFNKNTNGMILKNESPTQRMQYRLDILDANSPSYLLDDSAYYAEYEAKRMIISSTDYSNKAILKNVVTCTRKDSKIIKRTNKIFMKLNEWIKESNDRKEIYE